MQHHPVTVIVLLIVSVLISAWLVIRAQHDPLVMDRPYPVWRWDDAKATYFVGNSTDGKAVTAHIFACGSCNDERSRFAGFLTRADGAVRRIDDDTWHPGLTDAANAIAALPRERCRQQGGKLVRCPPPR